MALNADDVEKLARLARLDLTDDERATIGPQLDTILGFIEKLSELDTTDVEPMTTALDVDNRWRDDQPTPGLSRNAALANAPAHDDECFRVPPVLGRRG